MGTAVGMAELKGTLQLNPSPGQNSSYFCQHVLQVFEQLLRNAGATSPKVCRMRLLLDEELLPAAALIKPAAALIKR